MNTTLIKFISLLISESLELSDVNLHRLAKKAYQKRKSIKSWTALRRQECPKAQMTCSA